MYCLFVSGFYGSQFKYLLAYMPLLARTRVSQDQRAATGAGREAHVDGILCSDERSLDTILRGSEAGMERSGRYLIDLRRLWTQFYS